jgi:hypothetical protein
MIDGKLFSWSGKMGTVVNLPVSISSDFPVENFLGGSDSENFYSLQVRSNRTGKVMQFFRSHTELVKDNNNNPSLVIHYRQYLLPSNIYIRSIYNRSATFLKPRALEFIKSWREELKEEMRSAHMADTWVRAEFDAINESWRFCDRIETLIAAM